MAVTKRDDDRNRDTPRRRDLEEERKLKCGEN